MAMIKVIDPRGWDFDRPIAQMVKMSSRGLRGQDRADFIKIASHAFLGIADNLKLAKDEIPIHLIALGASEAYGCFVAGTQVRTADGQTASIESLQLGDQVVTHTGRTGPILTLYRRDYVGEICNVHVAGLLDPITCTANHPFFVIPREQVECREDRSKHCKPGTCGKNSLCETEACSRAFVSYHPEWRAAGELRPGDYTLTPIPDRDVGLQTWRWSKALAKLLGYFVAEGCYTKKKGELTGLSFSFNVNEQDTLCRDLRDCVADLGQEYEGLKLTGPYIHENCVQFRISSKSLATRIKKCVGEYAGGKFLGGQFYFQTADTLRYFFAGWLDGDGTCPVYTTKNGYDEHRYTIGSKSKRLVQDAQWLLAKCGVVAAACPVKDDTFYHLSFTNTAGNVFKDVAFKHRQADVTQLKEHSFIWNGYVCRPVRQNDVTDQAVPVFNIEVDGDHSYTVGNGVAVKNCNRNGDGFKEATCREHHKTFEKYAKWYRNHTNKDPKHSFGYVKASAYNDEMRRVELLCILNASKAAAERNGGFVADKEMEKIAKGEDLSVSMACRIPFDICSSCGHEARTRDEYCTESSCIGPHGEKRGGCRHNLTKVGSDGHILHVDNPNPVWFDISNVFRPADRIAYGSKADYLTKAASHQFMPGAELADALGLTAPLSVIAASDDSLAWSPAVAAQVKIAHGLAHYEGSFDVPGHLRLAVDGRLCPALSREQLDILGRPGTEKAATALRALADRKILLSFNDFARWLGKDALTKTAGDVLPTVYQRLVSGGLERRLLSNPYAVSMKTASVAQRTLAQNLESTHSLAQAAVQERAMRSSVRGLEPPVKAGSDKRLSGSNQPEAVALAEAYGLYKLAALHHIAGFDHDFHLTAKLALAQNGV